MADTVLRGESLQDVSYGWMLVKMIFFLVLVVGLIFITAYLFKKWIKGESGYGGEQVKMISQVTIAPNKVINFIKIFDEIVVVLETQTSSTVISREKSEEYLPRVESLNTEHTGKFINLLKEKLS